jgi:hypothetical protein
MRKLLLLLLVLITVCSCKIFDLRDSELPSEEAHWNDFASSWQLVLQNLHYAYQDSRNAINYGRIFSSNFRFLFAPQDITDFSTDQEWNLVQEQDMLLNLHAGYANIILSLENMETPDEISSNSAILYRSYELSATPRDPSREIVIARGKLEFYMTRQNGYWYINLWKDYRSSGERTWGLLKHENG